MMKMVDMKMPKKPKKDFKVETGGMLEQDEYPYGMRMRIGEEHMDKMPHVMKLNVGDMVRVEGVGAVISKSANERSGGKKDRSVEVQMHKVGMAGMGMNDHDEGFEEGAEEK